MTSVADHVTPGPGPVVWITGLSGTGKTTLANAAAALLGDEGRAPVLLDGDDVRRALDPEDLAGRHDREQRLRRAFRLATMASDAAQDGATVLVATISLFHEVQCANRARNARYAEVLLTADFETLRARNPRRYGGFGHPGEPDVVGVHIRPEFPAGPELMLVQRFHRNELATHAAQVVALVRSLERQGGRQ